MENDDKQMLAVLKVLTTYLLFERKQETELSSSFALLAQERHNNFHTEGDRKNGDGTSFGDCSNEMCQMAMMVLKETRQSAIEINDLSINMIDSFLLRIMKSGRTCRAWLEQKSPIVKPEGT